MATAKKNNPVSYVQMDGLVVMKIIKHCEDEGSGVKVPVQGMLMGLIEGECLEVTHSFPLPKQLEKDDQESKYYGQCVEHQLQMMENLRQVNVDHLAVGWYQCSPFGAHINRAFIDSQFSYQNPLDESIVLVYEPERSAKGLLSLRAFRLSSTMMQLYRERDFSPEVIKLNDMGYDSMIEEVPLLISNSHLVNFLLCELENAMPRDNKYSYLHLSSRNAMEKNLRLLIEGVDELAQDTNNFFTYQRTLAKQKQQLVLKKQQENKARKERGEAILPDDDLKLKNHPPRLDSLMLAAQIGKYTNNISSLASQSLGKLFVADRLSSQPLS